MFRHVVVAGTFDRLHKGHIAVLRRAFAEGERVTIGLTTDEYVQKFKSQNSELNDQIHSCVQRKKNLLDWLTNKGFIERASVIPLDNPYGPVVPRSPHDPAEPEVDAIVVSTETRPRAEDINKLRQEAGWKPLAIIEVPMVPAEDLAPISSTRVRKREIDRDGRLILPDNLRPELQKPLGKVLMGSEIERSIAEKQGLTLIAVGDVATKTLLDAGVVPSLAIIDGRVGRKPFYDVVNRLQPQKASPFEATAVKSGPGYISGEATRAIQQWAERCHSGRSLPRTLMRGAGIQNKDHGSRVKPGMTVPPIVVIVDGEEDLLALPAIAQAPLGAVVYYGQPRIADVRGKPPIESVKGLPGTTSMPGLVEVVVTEEKRREAKKLLAQFLKSDQSDQYSNE